MSDQITVTISQYEATENSDSGLEKLFTVHLKQPTTAEALIERLHAGKTITVTLPKEGADAFFQGLENYQLEYEIAEN